MLSEAEIIGFLKQQFISSDERILGIGDDAAVLPLSSEQALVISKDILAENVHFRLNYFSPEALAHKALHSNFSDLAAMGVKPLFVMLGISIPPHLDAIWTKNFLAVFAKVCKENNVNLIGGDTTAAASELFLSITVFGFSPPKFIKYRSAAKVGDLICVTGNLGGAHLGLLALERKLDGFEYYKNKQLFPRARTAEGLFLGQYSSSLFPIHSMLDISDGLFIDLQRLCEASKVGAVLQVDKIPTDPDFEKTVQLLGIDPIQAKLGGGEDYELLFTVDAESFFDLQINFRQKFKSNIFSIGQIVKESGVYLEKDGQPLQLKVQIFEHF